MSSRNVILANNQIYHIYNRSIGKEDIFNNKRHSHRALDLISYYRFPHKKRYSHFKNLSEEEKKTYSLKIKKSVPLVEIYAFALMPNHFHLLVKQIKNKGIAKFISNFQNSFAKYFNLKNERTGSLFQNMFKAKRIESDEDLLNVSRYIHLNPVSSFLVRIEKLVDYPWTSFSYYLGNNSLDFIFTDILLTMFESKNKYKKFVFDQSGYEQEIKKIKKLLLEKHP